MRAVAIGFDKKSVARPMEFLFFVTQLRDGSYMNVFDEKALDKSKQVSWDKTAIEEFVFFKYEVTDNRLELRPGSGSAARAAIESGKLQGKVMPNFFWTSTQITDTPARLTKFLETAGGRELFHAATVKPLVLLRRPIP